MTNPNNSAHPWHYHDANGQHDEENGLTKREEFAKAAMQAIISSPMRFTKNGVEREKTGEFVGELAVYFADALIAALNK